MSDLLQQAIIDATALKEAAIKNAENMLIEKYSQEFEQTVQKLLEQEQVAAPTGQAGTDVPPAAMPGTPVGPGMDLTSTDNFEQQTGDKAFANVPSSFLDGDENEMITINFDQIKKTMMEMFDHEENVSEEYDRREPRSDVTGDSLAAGEPDPKITEEESSSEEELDEDLELDESLDGLEEDATYSEPEAVESLEEAATDPVTAGSQETAEAARLKQQAAKKETDAAYKKAAASAEMQKELEAAEKEKALETSQQELEENIELTEEEFLELTETMKVDVNVGSIARGYMGSTENEKKLQRNTELAAARDDKATEDREEEKKKLEDLSKENKELKEFNNSMLATFESLKEEVEKVNLSNAKLLYTNKALGNISLNERQKQNIVESISKADSVLAAKTIYETLQNAVENAPVKKEAPQSLREALNRAQSPFVVKKSSVNNVNDVMSERLKALAGIKKVTK